MESSKHAGSTQCPRDATGTCGNGACGACGFNGCGHGGPGPSSVGEERSWAEGARRRPASTRSASGEEYVHPDRFTRSEGDQPKPFSATFLMPASRTMWDK
ncbi:unnamed protein product [Cladocopium goreaui]|uniref:Uncharacterized protein n=1 Tax=Cladocopium goreaui TaxID=2562237 RepID=A0A9P1CN33_9DINO|nr:unnamed protein product [Cladocopium goreaui]